MRKKRASVVNSLIVLAAILSVLLSACGALETSQPTNLSITKTIPTSMVIPPTETAIPSPTPDTRPRLLTTDNGAVLRPETEINDTNFQRVKLLGTLGSGIPVVVQFSPDDTLLAVGTSIGEVNIYNANNLELIQTIQTSLLLQFPLKFINSSTICDPCGRLAISPDNKLLGILSIDGKIQIWNLEKKQQIASSTEASIAWVTEQRLAGVGVHSGWRTLRFSDDSEILGVFGETIWWPPGVCLYASHEQCVRNFERPYFVLSASGSAWSIPLWCGKFACPTSSSVEIHDDLSQFNDAFTFAPENSKLPPIPLPEKVNEKTDYKGKSFLKPQYISPDGSRALSYDYYGVLNNFPRYGNSEVIYAGTLWDVINNKVINTFSFPYVDVYALSHDLGSIAYMTPIGVSVLDIPSGTSRGEISIASSCLGELTFSPDRSILAGHYRSVIYLCDPLTGNITRTISVPTGFISSIAFSPDGKFIASTGQTWGNYLSTSKEKYDPYVYIWNVPDGSLAATLEHQGDTMIAEFSPDGKYIATGAGVDSACAGVTSPKDERFTLWSWDGQSANIVKEQKFEAGVANLAFSPNSRQILLATNQVDACSRKQPLIYLYDISQDVFSKSYYQLGRGDPPTILQFAPDTKQFVYGAYWEAAMVSISTNDVNPEFSLTKYISIAEKEFLGIYAKYTVISVSPSWSVLAFPMSNQIKISDITYSRQFQIPGKFIYSKLVFSPDGRTIYGGANIFGVISVWGIPSEK